MVVRHTDACDDAGDAYRIPHADLAALIDAPPTPEVSICPRRERMIVLRRRPLTRIEELAQPELRLAGLRINPRTNSRSRESF